MRKKEIVRRQFRVVLAAGVSGLGGVGVVLLGPAGLVLGAVFLLGVIVFACAVVFSRREEPIQRVLKLIKVLWRDR